MSKDEWKKLTKNEWKKWVGVVGRMLLAYALVFAQGAWATQSQATKDKSASPQKAAAQQEKEKQPAVPAKAAAQTKRAQGEESESAVAEGKPSGDGRHEGIKVHGHWTIEVRNPDGTLVTHREFENALIRPGAILIGNLLQGVYVPAGWLLHIGGTNSSQNPPNAANPCGPGSFGADGSFLNTGITSGSPAPAYCNVIESGAECNQFMVFAPSSTFCTLTRTPAVGTTVLSGSITVSGSFQAAASGYVGTVVSEDQICSNIGNNLAPGLATVSPSACNAGTGGGIQTNFLTAAVLASPVQVQAGQTVAVTVVLSFS